MAVTKGYWGIDIGQCALKAVRLEVEDGKPVATAFDYIEHPKVLSQPDADPEALIHEALEKFLARNPLGRDEVSISVPGQAGLVRFVKLPPVEEKKIPDIVKFEAKQQIPFPLEDVVWDFQKISGGEAVGGFAMETEVGLFAMKRDVISRQMSHFRKVDVDVHMIQMASLAICNFGTYELLKKGGPDPVEADGAPLLEGEDDDTPRGKRRCAVIMDIGTDNSNLIITDGSKIIWQRLLQLGGNHFTRALTKDMKLTFAKAEHLKRNAAKSPELAQILKALRPVLTEFVGEVQRSLGYFTNTHKEAHVAYMVGIGNAFRLPGLQKYLAEKLSLTVLKPSKLERFGGEDVLNNPTFAENILTFPVALGLALQNCGLARLQTNLLPEEIRVDRLIRAKKPWAAAAAACLLLGSGVVAFGYSAQLSSVTDEGIKQAMNTGNSAVSLFKSQESERTSKEQAVSATQAEVKTIIAGNEDRLNWVRLNEVLVAALPRHGDPERNGAGGNLNDPDQVPFWSTPEGVQAYRKYKDRMGEGIPLEKLFDDDLAQHLAQVNLEAIYCRWTDEPTLFLENADKMAHDEFGLVIADDMTEAEREEDEANQRNKPKSIDGGYWVFELRGYTAHKDGTNFLRKCMLKNLQKSDYFADQTKGTSKVRSIIPDAIDPVKGRVSHVFLLLSQPDTEPQPNRFKFINKTWIDALCNPQPAGGGGGFGGEDDLGGGAMPADGGSGTGEPAEKEWLPLWGSGPTPSGRAGKFGGGQRGFGPGSGDDGAVDDGYEMPAGPRFPSKTGKDGKPAKLKPKTRYEFVVCFLWKEPSQTLGADDAPAEAD